MNLAMVFSMEHTCSKACLEWRSPATTDDMCTFLEHIGQSKYYQWFKENGIADTYVSGTIGNVKYLREELKIVDEVDAIIISRLARTAHQQGRQMKNLESVRRSRQKRKERIKALKEDSSEEAKLELARLERIRPSRYIWLAQTVRKMKQKKEIVEESLTSSFGCYNNQSHPYVIRT